MLGKYDRLCDVGECDRILVFWEGVRSRLWYLGSAIAFIRVDGSAMSDDKPYGYALPVIRRIEEFR